MRVIAGKARRINLCSLPGMETRPTQDRTKETLFNVLNPYIADSNFLDLFSGSGAIGIEALSRGCKMAVFVEKNPNAVNCIRTNLKNTKLEADAKVYTMEAISCIKKLENEHQVFDVIFMDPPYNHEFEKEILLVLNESKIIHEDTIVVVEASNETTFDYLEHTKFSIYRTKQYKTNKHVFLEVTANV